MKQGMGLTIEQKQELSLSPQLMQSIEILRYSLEELQDFIVEEAIENPMLETESEAGEKSLDVGEMAQEDMERWKVQLSDTTPIMDIRHSNRNENYTFLNFTSKDETLFDSLEEQLGYIDLPERTRRICRVLIENLDRNGYLKVSLEDLHHEYYIAMDLLEQALETIQGFEPVGVGARNLVECLLLQSQNREPATTIIREYLDDIANNRMKQVSKRLDIPMEALLDEVDFIRSLNPKPGASFATDEPIRYIIPDAAIVEVDGHYEILYNDRYLPRVSLNREYLDMLKREEKNTKAYLSEKQERADWIIRSIEQRKLTILRIIEVIVEEQELFLSRGIHYLTPMSQKHLANMLGLHESTISRATSGKYVETPQGIFELKYFFSNTIEAADGEELSSKSIRVKIEEIIEAEDKTKPLSDEKIRQMLQECGIDISRRTVAKYREEQGILKSSMRKSYL